MTYASVATQTGAGVLPADGDTVMERVAAPGPPPVGTGVLGGSAGQGVAGGGGAGALQGRSQPAEGVVRVQALLIYGVDCRRGVALLLSEARRLRV